MKESERNKRKKEYTFADFVAEFEEKKKKEKEDFERGAPSTVHFIGSENAPILFEPSELAEDDFELWKKVRDKTVTRADIEVHMRRLQAESKESGARYLINTRMAFFYYVGNIVTGIWHEKHAEGF